MRFAIYMIFRLLAAAALGAWALSSPASASELAPPPKVTSPRLYVFDCGTLVYNKPEDYNLKRDEVKDTNMGVTCYLVVHPRGMLIYDTGLNDRLVGRPLYENVLDGYAQIKFNTLSGQLADIGVRPSKIDYLVLSHYHWDHGWSTRAIATRCSAPRRALIPGSASIQRWRTARRCCSAATMTCSGTAASSCSQRRDIRRGIAHCWCA
jgi:beta-lactamase superfamily II metal-dependent hydrolase